MQARRPDAVPVTPTDDARPNGSLRRPRAACAPCRLAARRRVRGLAPGALAHAAAGDTAI